jgi:N-acetylglucosaminyldiphosphoundecaprenol N-acetyl-beta-D-mannosaminyltransferase
MLGKFTVVLPDGIGMCWAVRLLHGAVAARVSFDTTSLAPLVFQRAAQDGLTIALVGGRSGVAECAASQLRRAFPALRIVAIYPGYGDCSRTITELAALSPSIVICGMGAGPQEQFLIRLAETGWSGIGFTCGGYLDQLAQRLHYYPRWIDAANLRWAYRLIREPRRLARRYGLDYAVFLGRLAWAVVVPAAHARSQEQSI